MLLCVDFCGGYDPSLSTIQWDLKKPACESTEGSARPLKKKISCQTQKCNFWKRPSTDFDKNYIFGIGTSSAIEWYLSFLLSISWPSDEPWLTVTLTVNKRKCRVLIPGVIMNLAHIWQLCLFWAADSIDKLFYRNLIGWSFSIIDAFADNSCL